MLRLSGAMLLFAAACSADIAPPGAGTVGSGDVVGGSTSKTGSPGSSGSSGSAGSINGNGAGAGNGTGSGSGSTSTSTGGSNLTFAVFGDSRPPNQDDTTGYPSSVISSIFQKAQTAGAQFVVGTGDYMFASKQSSTSST